MFGISTFGELIFADMGGPKLDFGWQEIQGPDCDKSDWELIPSSCDEVNALDKGQAEWTVIK